MQRILKKFVFKLKDRFFWFVFPFGNLYFSQNGEDVVLSKIFDQELFGDEKYQGFYVDVGAYHPFRYSNTFYFYRKGWSGINIDADDRFFKLFSFFRKKDKNLNLAIGLNKEKRFFYIFEDAAFNTFDERLAKNLIKSGGSKLLDKRKLETLSLEEVLDKNLNYQQKIDFMNIDVEGLDLEVLKSNNWDKYAPRVILVENLQDQKRIKDIENFLKKKGYFLSSQVFNTGIYQKN